MGTPRKSITRISGPLAVILAITIAAFITFVVSRSYFLAVATLLVLGTGYGIYVLDEANNESHDYGSGVRQLISDGEDWTENMVDRARRMVERDKNHASIFAFSLGNEAGFGRNLDAERKLDQDALS